MTAAAAAVPMAAHARSRVLQRVADAIEQRSDRFADTITAKSDRPIGAARTEVLRAVDTLRLSAGRGPADRRGVDRDGRGRGR